MEDEEDDFLNDEKENFIMLTTRKTDEEKVFETGSKNGEAKIFKVDQREAK